MVDSFLEHSRQFALLVHEVKHYPGMHNQMNHGNRYHIDASTGKRVLKPKPPKAPKKVSAASAAAKFKKMDEYGKSDHLTQQYETWQKNLTSKELTAVHKYTGDGYLSMNHALRTNEVEGSYYASHIKEAAVGLLKGETPHAMTVKRGLNGNVQELQDLWAIAQQKENWGKTFVDKAFCSTTIKDTPSFGNSMQWTIHMPKGAPGAYVDSMSMHEGEKEFLLPPGCRFKIKSAHIATGGYTDVRHLELEFVGSTWQ